MTRRYDDEDDGEDDGDGGQKEKQARKRSFTWRWDNPAAGQELSWMYSCSLPPRRAPNDRSVRVAVAQRNFVALRVLQHPCEDTPVLHHGHAAYTMMTTVFQKRGPCNPHAIYDTGAANQNPTRFALGQVYPAPPRGCGTADLPILLAGQDFVEPLLLHDKRIPGAPLDTAPLACLFLGLPDFGVASSLATGYTRILCKAGGAKFGSM